MLDYYGSINMNNSDIDKQIIEHYRDKCNNNYIERLPTILRNNNILETEYSVSGWNIFFKEEIINSINNEFKLIKKKNEQLLSFVYCYENIYSDYDVLYLIRDKLNCIYSENISIKP